MRLLRKADMGSPLTSHKGMFPLAFLALQDPGQHEMFLPSALPFIFCALASAASIPSPTPTLSPALNATHT